MVQLFRFTAGRKQLQAIVGVAHVPVKLIDKNRQGARSGTTAYVILG